MRLKPFNPGILWKTGILKKIKNESLNGCISKTRANSESKLTCSESSFNFLQKSVAFCVIYSRGYTAGAPSPPDTTHVANARGLPGPKS